MNARLVVADRTQIEETCGCVQTEVDAYESCGRDIPQHGRVLRSTPFVLQDAELTAPCPTCGGKGWYEAMPLEGIGCDECGGEGYGHGSGWVSPSEGRYEADVVEQCESTGSYGNGSPWVEQSFLSVASCTVEVVPWEKVIPWPSEPCPELVGSRPHNRHPKRCRTCGGSGWAPGDSVITADFEGTGSLWLPRSIFDSLDSTRPVYLVTELRSV